MNTFPIEISAKGRPVHNYIKSKTCIKIDRITMSMDDQELKVQITGGKKTTFGAIPKLTACCPS